MDDKGERVPTDVKDKEDGTYEIKFTAHRPATYCLKVSNEKIIRFTEPRKVFLPTHYVLVAK